MVRRAHSLLTERGREVGADADDCVSSIAAWDQLLTVSRGFVREQSRLDCLALALGERALRPQPRVFLELRVPPLKGRRLDHGSFAPCPPLTSAQTGGPVTGVGI